MQKLRTVAESLRKEHRRVRRDIEHAGIMAGVLAERRASRQRNRMQMIGAILDDCVRSHRAWEARVLEPLVGRPGEPAKDALAGSIGELAREAGARLPDVQVFGTRLDGVIAALNTHLEQEQRLLRRIAH